MNTTKKKYTFIALKSLAVIPSFSFIILLSISDVDVFIDTYYLPQWFDVKYEISVNLRVLLCTIMLINILYGFLLILFIRNWKEKISSSHEVIDGSIQNTV